MAQNCKIQAMLLITPLETPQIYFPILGIPHYSYTHRTIGGRMWKVETNVFITISFWAQNYISVPRIRLWEISQFFEFYE
jgi:hypothetical protein